MHPFTLSRPADARDAIAAHSGDPQSSFIAGGTDLIGLMKDRAVLPAHVIDINGLPGMSDVDARPDGSLHPIQAAFLQEHGLQCGFCTPGMIMRTHRLLQENPDPTDDEIRMGLSGNICRCTGYQNIVKAVRSAAGQLGARKEAAE